MNILYISKMTGQLWAGPNTSVPMQIVAQSKMDHVFWYNMNQIKLEKWSEMGAVCHNINDYPTGRLNDLPSPFNCPDIAVVEEFYTFPFSPMVRDLKKKNIPYVIVPRSTMTKQAQNHKPIKKFIGNLVWFRKMAARASAIHFLTEEEKNDCTIKWNDNSFVIPNGIDVPEYHEKQFCPNGINAVYIGRIEVYQKGLDILCETLARVKDQLRSAGFSLVIYGPDRENSKAAIEQMISDMDLSDLVSIKDAVFGEEKKTILQKADLFMMTSRFEGLPMGLLEALAWGVPSLVTTGTNMATQVAECQAGWVAENTSDSVADAIERMLSEKAKLPDKGKNAVALARKYSWDAIARDSHEVYCSILKRNQKECR
ncbi:MAG: glycosyltransferase [Clostridia bacterium]|nr:glycosyltransferase [Clostridia bacterium]